jgi:hypothetical protein
MFFKVNRPKVIFEIFDDEVVLINMDNGNYYSINGVAASIWRCIESGEDRDRIIETISIEYEGSRGDIENGVVRFLAQLQQEGLILAAEKEENKGVEAVESRPEKEAKIRPAFATPTITRYTDMQDLLLLDPIHEVDDTGWPEIKPDPDRKRT